MSRNIGKHDELFAQLCDPEHLIQSARAAARQKKQGASSRASAAEGYTAFNAIFHHCD